MTNLGDSDNSKLRHLFCISHFEPYRMWNHPQRYKCQFVRVAVEAFEGDTGVLLLSFAVVVDESVPNGDGVESGMTSKMAVSLVDRFQQQRSLFQKLLAVTVFFL